MLTSFAPVSPLAFAAFVAQRLGRFDLGIVVVYLIGITLFGLRFRKGEQASGRSLRSYFLADNTVPWWAIALSIVSAETSTLTIISIPGVAFTGDFGFLQIVIGYMIGRIVVAALFLPRYFAGEMLTAYQLIDRRFGPLLHKVTAALFLLTRAAAEGVRVFAVSIVVGIAIGTRDVLSIGIISALTLLYTFEGGMTAVIWTDVVQMFIYVGGTFVALATLGSHVHGGWHEIHHVAAAAGKFHMLNFALNLTTTYTFWAGIVGGTFLTMASHGTDQLMVQRLLAARNLRESRLALLSSGVVIFMQFTLFLLIGAGLYVYYAQNLGTTFASADRIFPTFIVREMPLGIAGLLVAAILAAAMSNLSAALNSLSSTTVVDFYMRARPTADGRERGLISRASTVLWALVLFAIAIYSVRAGGKGHVVEVGLSIASVAYGCLLGVFLLGTLTRFATETGATIGMVSGFVLNVWLWQGTFPAHLGAFTVPHVAWTWYVFIGALVTFAIGVPTSLLFRKQSTRHAQGMIAGLVLVVILSGASRRCDAQSKDPEEQQHATTAQKVFTANADFTQVSQLVNDAIAAHKLPGAVVLIGHNGHVAFEHAYGNRKLNGEPGLDGKLSPAEPMTEDTIFDMASLTKCLATATAIMQLYDQGKLDVDTPIATYLPEFITTSPPDPRRARVTVRMLLTHFSGEPADVNLKDAWGLASPDKAEGFRRALATPLQSAPAETMRYSDVNYILLGALIEKLSGETEDVYAQEHIFTPLGMTETRYLPIEQACGAYKTLGSAIIWEANYSNGKNADGTVWGSFRDYACPPPKWIPQGLLPRIAPTAHDNEGNAQTNPDFDHLLRGTVHDPTTRRMGGVAGYAGVFSTAHDMSLFAQALLDKLTQNTGPFPLKQSTLELMTTPQQPGHNAQQLIAAIAAERAAIASGAKPAEPGLLPNYPAVKGQDLRGFGWDIDTGFSKPRGAVFPIGSFGHTGFTGTSLWMDPASDTYVILLSNAIHPRGNPPISNLRGEVATAAARDLSLQREHDVANCNASNAFCDPTKLSYEVRAVEPLVAPANPDFCHLPVLCDSFGATPNRKDNVLARVMTGIDVLEASHFSQFTALHLRNFGVLSNQAGMDAEGHRTIDILATELPKALPAAKLVTLFSPEHGIAAAQDSTNIASETDAATGLHVTSLYGAKDADRRPSHDQLKNLDVVIIDLQDAGVHFWTYESVLGYFLEAAATERNTYNHDLKIIVLDRPNPIDGDDVQGPVIDAGRESYTGYMQLPVRHGLSYGELAQYINGEKHLSAALTIIAIQGWSRAEYFSDTGLQWVNPSPNLRSPTAAILYPALGLIESTNVSVGRGTDAPFSFFGAGIPSKSKTGAAQTAWFQASDVAAYLTARKIAGIVFTATKQDIVDDANHYPFHGQTIEAVHVEVTDRSVLDTPELGIEILSALHHLYPTQFSLDKAMTLIANRATMDALNANADPRAIAASWLPPLTTFKASRKNYLLYH